MTDTQSALLAAILSDPASDDPRLVYADWLDENGHPERAEFIRVQVELARLSNLDISRSPVDPVHRRIDSEKSALRARERELWHQLPTCKEFAPWASGISTDPDRTRFWVGNQSGPLLEVTRGFVSRITSADWLRHADSLYWRPGATMECPECGGRGTIGRGSGHDFKLVFCRCYHAPGRVPRPMPPGAQPIERVVLTTPMGVEPGWREMTRPRVGVNEWTSPRWHGIVFEVRPMRIVQGGTSGTVTIAGRTYPITHWEVPARPGTDPDRWPD